MRPAPVASVLAAAAVLAACATRPPAPAAGLGVGAPGAAAAAPSDRRWADGAVFYEIFVRSFQDSDGDGAGDLRGLVSRLDHLNDGDPATTSDLGVDAIWLMPVFASPSYHGYDTTDHAAIEPDYGTLEDFDLLVREAHRRGLRIVLDLVLNHTSDEHPWFVEAASSRSSPRRDWYLWRDANPRWAQPWNARGETWHPLKGAYYYGLFWSGMPDLNFRNPAVRAEAKRIASSWLARGADGFRLDAARHLVETGPGEGQSDTAETHAFWRELAAHVRSVKPDAILVGEAWSETPVIAAYHGSGEDELDVTFDFPLAARIVDGVRRGDASGIAAKLAEVARTYPPGAISAPFLTNHDMRRVASELGGDPARLRVAAAILLTVPGSPVLYYGEEIGLANGEAPGDEAKRTPMRWDETPGGGFTAGRPWHPPAPGRPGASVAAQAGDPGSLLSHYRALLRARRDAPALGRGAFEPVASPAPLLAFLRRLGDDRVLAVHNLGAEPASLEVPGLAAAGVVLATRGAAIDALPDGVRVAVPPGGSVLLHVR